MIRELKITRVAAALHVHTVYVLVEATHQINDSKLSVDSTFYMY